MKQLILTIVMLAGMMSCTHNNGDIGPWFGSWKLESITIDGMIDEEYAEKSNIIWKFQSSVIEMQELLPMHETTDHFGSWQQTSAKTVEMKFNHRDDHNPDGGTYYAPPTATHLPRGEFSLNILVLGSSRMKLQYNAPDGIIYTYFLVKW